MNLPSAFIQQILPSTGGNNFPNGTVQIITYVKLERVNLSQGLALSHAAGKPQCLTPSPPPFALLLMPNALFQWNRAGLLFTQSDYIALNSEHTDLNHVGAKRQSPKLLRTVINCLLVPCGFDAFEPLQRYT